VSIQKKNSHSLAVWPLPFFDLSLVKTTSDQEKLENYVAVVDVQPTGTGRMGSKS